MAKSKETVTKKKNVKTETKDKKGKTSNTTKSASKPKKTLSESKKIAQLQKEIEKNKTKFEEINEKYLRLSAEYDNYRKRTLKEKMELTKSGGEDILINILPVVDDFERALNAIGNSKDIKSVSDGINLIYNKLIEFLKTRGIKEIDAKEKEFDTDVHEAITKIPAPNKKLKGKVVDVIEKGYFLHDKVIRFSKVVIGE